MPCIRIKESHRQTKEMEDDDNHVFTKKVIEKSMYIADPQEDCYKIVKRFVAETVKKHFTEC